MPLVARGIGGLHHGAQGQAADQEIQVRVPCRAQHQVQVARAGLGRKRRGQAGGPQQLEQGLQLGRIGVGMDAVQKGRSLFREEPGHGLVGRDHEFLDDLVPEMAYPGPDVHGLAVKVEMDFRLGQVEIQGAAFPAQGVEQPGQLLGLFQHGQDRGHGLPLGLVAQEKPPVHLGVGQPGGALDHRRIEGGFADDPLVGELHVRHHGQPGHMGIQAAQAVGEPFRKHGLHGLGEIIGVAPLQGLLVQGRALGHVVGHVGDGHPQAVAPGDFLHVDGVVEVPGLGPVDGHEGHLAQILASGEIGLARLLGKGLGLGQGAPGEDRGHLVVDLDQPLLHGGVALGPQKGRGRAGIDAVFQLLPGRDGDDVFQGRLLAAGLGPVVGHEAHGLAGVRGAAQEQIGPHALDHPAGKRRLAPFQDAGHPALVVLPGPLPGHGGGHPVAVPGVAHVPVGNEEILAALVVGDDVAHTRAGDLQPPHQKLHALGQAVGPVDADQPPLLHQVVQDVAHLLAAHPARLQAIHHLVVRQGLFAFPEKLDHRRRAHVQAAR